MSKINLKDKIAIIGTGNMGSALAKGIAGSGMAENLMLHDTDINKVNQFARSISATACSSIQEAIHKSQLVILCVKPNIVLSVAQEVSKFLNPGTIVCSIAVGVPIAKYRTFISGDFDFFRIMPNTPALVGEGMSVISHEKGTSEDSLEKVLKIFSCAGKTQVLDEKLMNQVTALTGSSPAYVFMMIEAMGNAGIKSGIPSEISYKLAAQAVLGSAKMVLESGLHPAVLKDQVCSPAGTTIEAVEALERNGFRYCLMDAMNECTKRAEEISEKKE